VQGWVADVVVEGVARLTGPYHRQDQSRMKRTYRENAGALPHTETKDSHWVSGTHRLLDCSQRIVGWVAFEQPADVRAGLVGAVVDRAVPAAAARRRSVGEGSHVAAKPAGQPPRGGTGR
jgi:hypothetical protein